MSHHQRNAPPGMVAVLNREIINGQVVDSIGYHPQHEVGPVGRHAEQKKHAKRQTSTHIEQSNEFIGYFKNPEYYEFSHNVDNDPHFGQAAIYKLKDNKIENWNGVPRCLDNDWLPITVALKTFRGLPHNMLEDLQQQVRTNLKTFIVEHQEILPVYAYENSQDSKDLTLFYEYQKKTLDEDIHNRQVEQNQGLVRAFSEKLLWKLLYSLVRSTSVLKSTKQDLQELRAANIFYEYNQVKVIPFGVNPDKHGNQQGMQCQERHEHQPAHIAFTILKAALLLTDSQFNPNQNLGSYIQDFKGRYPGTDGILAFIIEKVLLNENNNDIEKLFKALQVAEHDIFHLNLFQVKKALKATLGQTYPEFGGNGVQEHRKHAAKKHAPPVTAQEKLQLAADLFAQHDEDGSGQLDYKEIKALLKEFYQLSGMGYTPTDQDVEMWVRGIDKDNTGTISREEYIEFQKGALRRAGLKTSNIVLREPGIKFQ